MLVYSPRYNTDLASYGIDKPFALDRGQKVLDALAEEFGGEAASYDEPRPISEADILRVHTPAYLATLSKTSTWLEIMEFKKHEYFPEKAIHPLNALIDDIKLKCGGTLHAAELALQHGLAANLGGGYHHAFPDQGRGYCVLHDIAIAIRTLQSTGKIRQAMVIDLDFHQGDGTARVFAGDASVFTLSVHSQEGWPDEKQQSSLDVGLLESQTSEYLPRTRAALDEALRRFSTDLVIYVAGSDPYELDVLPGTRFLKLTLDELDERDRLVIDRFADLGIPLAMVFAGGYGPHVWEVHFRAVRHLLHRVGIVGSTARQS
jgi:acetoin utilization deacetylase AcuC-like enzyme